MATRHGDGIGSMPCGRAATSDGALDDKTKDLIALALSVAARCDPCIGFHTQTMVQLEATSQELGETLGVATYIGGGPVCIKRESVRSLALEGSPPAWNPVTCADRSGHKRVHPETAAS